jgi:release factor glutamine methyltransferase
MCVNIHTLKDIKPYLSGELASIYPETEINAFANIIMKTLFKVSKLHILTLPECRLTEKNANKVISICRELKMGKPLQYILGETCFYNCLIKVNSATLIPRSETEELVDIIVKENKGSRGTILDIGTGSGCIAIALAVNLPGTRVLDFFTADMTNFDIDSIGNIDIIVSNPPYVRESEKNLMAGNVLNYEPHSALFIPDSEPLKYYNHILKLAKDILVWGGRVYFEINEAMGAQMKDMLSEHGYTDIVVNRDLNGRERMIKGIRNE